MIKAKISYMRIKPHYSCSSTLLTLLFPLRQPYWRKCFYREGRKF